MAPIMHDPLPPPDFELRDSDGFAALIGPLFRRETPEGASYGMRLASQHMNAGGVAHGGLLTAFADNCLGATVHRAVAAPCTTIGLTVSFVAPGRDGDWIECAGTITRATRSLVFISGRVWCGGLTLLDAQGIWKILRD